MQGTSPANMPCETPFLDIALPGLEPGLTSRFEEEPHASKRTSRGILRLTRALAWRGDSRSCGGSGWAVAAPPGERVAWDGAPGDCGMTSGSTPLSQAAGRATSPRGPGERLPAASWAPPASAHGPSPIVGRTRGAAPASVGSDAAAKPCTTSQYGVALNSVTYRGSLHGPWSLPRQPAGVPPHVHCPPKKCGKFSGAMSSCRRAFAALSPRAKTSTLANTFSLNVCLMAFQQTEKTDGTLMRRVLAVDWGKFASCSFVFSRMNLRSAEFVNVPNPTPSRSKTTI
mmetsp:Transcript_48893/g.148779  ORF Transcript_48893/g.148779 Transcript_48893/m.148779 type:complete len:285 (-) Transcript_48893:289-1143(-)